MTSLPPTRAKALIRSKSAGSGGYKRGWPPFGVQFRKSGEQKAGPTSDKGQNNRAIGVRKNGSGSRLEPGSLCCCCLSRNGPWCLAACDPSSISFSGSGTRFLSVALTDRVCARSPPCACASGTDCSGTPSRAPEPADGCRPSASASVPPLYSSDSLRENNGNEH